tara:strand:- start:3055 stop:3861 length:807 start_codon:yes stop_codon:yes gene_type:complete
MKSNLKLLKDKLNSITSFWCSNFSLATLKSYRIFEIKQVSEQVPFNKKKVLEIGSGFGWQSNYLHKLGSDVKAVDIASSVEDGLQSSNYNLNKYKVFDDLKNQEKKKINNISKIEFPVEKYDGVNLPYENETFDIVFTSNVLSHVEKLDTLLKDMKRVLKKDGILIHGCASSNWCFWTLLTGLIKRWYIDPRSHSVYSNNVFSEIINSREKFWKKYFNDNGLKTINVIGSNLFYTGNSIFDCKISIQRRNKLSKILGSSTIFYVLKII